MVNNKKRDFVGSLFLVGIPGLEPGKTGPESVVLPLHHIPRLVSAFESSTSRSQLRCKGTAFCETVQAFGFFFAAKLVFCVYLGEKEILFF